MLTNQPIECAVICYLKKTCLDVLVELGAQLLTYSTLRLNMSETCFPISLDTYNPHEIAVVLSLF